MLKTEALTDLPLPSPAGFDAQDGLDAPDGLDAQDGPRVAYLVNQYPKVSHTFIRREILALERRGVAVHRFALRGWDAAVVDPEDIAERRATRYVLRDGVLPLIAAMGKSLVRQPGATLRALRAALAMSRRSVRPFPYHLVYLAHACRLKDWLEAERLPHVHAHFGTNTAEVCVLLRALGGPSYSFTVHGADEADHARHLSLDRKVADARFVAAISAYTRSQLMRWCAAVHWPRIKVIHCGLEEAFFAAEPAPLPAQPVFLCIGRLSPEKGHLVLLEAFARIAATNPGAKLVLAGDGEMRGLIEARIAALGLAAQVQITGWIASDAVRAHIRAASLIVQPSLMEGLPVVIMEAMAQGRAVISTYIAGIPELVEPGVSGWLVPAGEVGSLAEAMAEALALAPAELHAMGRAGTLAARARHHVDTEAGKLAQLFAEAAAASRQDAGPATGPATGPGGQP